MVKIRLARGGGKKKPFYYVVVADYRSARDGRFIERVGFFDPVGSTVNVGLSLNMDRVKYWIHHGAQPSKRVACLMKQQSMNK